MLLYIQSGSTGTTWLHTVILSRTSWLLWPFAFGPSRPRCVVDRHAHAKYGAHVPSTNHFWLVSDPPFLCRLLALLCPVLCASRVVLVPPFLSDPCHTSIHASELQLHLDAELKDGLYLFAVE